MKYTFLTIALFPLFLSLQAQVDPVSWAFEVNKEGSEAFSFLLKAKLQPGWYIYSQHLDPDAGPVATSVHFQPSEDVVIEGHVLESGDKKTGYDELFGTNITKFSGEVVFSQSVRLLNSKGSLSGYIEYMTCNDEQCLPPRQVSFDAVFQN